MHWHLARTDIAYIELSVLAHATEDNDKVLKATQNLLLSNPEHEVSFSKDTVKGEYGNPITYYRGRLAQTEQVELVLANLGAGLSALDKETLLSGLELRMRKKDLYIRLDKQAAFNGKFRLHNADPIRLRIKFNTSKTEKVKEICRRLGIIP